MSTEIMVFWNCDIFPFFLWDIATEMNENCEYKVKDYGWVINPAFVLSYTHGTQLSDKLKQLKDNYQDDIKQIKESYSDEIKMALRQQGVIGWSKEW